MTGGTDCGVVGFGVGDGIVGGAEVCGDCSAGSTALMAKHGVPAGVFEEGKVGGFEFDDPSDVFVGVFFLSDEGRGVVADSGDGEAEAFAVGAEGLGGGFERFIAEFLTAVSVGGDVGPLVDAEVGFRKLSGGDRLEEFDFESAGDVADGDHFVKVGGDLVGGDEGESLEAEGWLGFFAGFGEELPESAVADVADVDFLIGAFDESIGSGGEAGFSLRVVTAGMEEDGALPDAFDVFEEDAIEATEGDITDEPLSVVGCERAFEIFEDDGLAGGAVDLALREVDGGWGLIAGAADFGIDVGWLEGGGVGVFFFEEVVAVEGSLGEADEFVGGVEDALVVEDDHFLIGADGEAVGGAVSSGEVGDVDFVGCFRAGDGAEEKGGAAFCFGVYGDVEIARATEADGGGEVSGEEGAAVLFDESEADGVGVEVGLGESVDEDDFFIGGEEAVAIAIFESGDLVFFSDVDLAVVNGDRGRFVEVAHEAVSLDFGAVGIADESGDFEHFAFFEGLFVLAVGGKDGDVEVVAAKGHGGDLEFDVLEGVEVLEFAEGVEMVRCRGGIEGGSELLLFLFGGVFREGEGGQEKEKGEDAFHGDLGIGIKRKRGTLNRMKKVLLSLFVGSLSGVLSAAPLKVYILTGQSNMEGHAKISSFDHVGMDPKTAPILKEMRNSDGSPRVLDDVWISYRTGSEEMPVGVGKLTAGWGSRKDPTQDGGKIGPEFTFGIYAEKLLGEPVLIIKAAWGGKSIHTDFRPPSAGPYEFRDDQIEQFKKQGKNIDEIKAERAAATGKYYRLMMDHVKAVLSDPKKAHPGYDAKEGVELAGIVWFQGWNDMVAQDVYPKRDQPGGYDDYSKVLAHFIRDVRKDLNAPKLPFVIGVMGAGGPTKDYKDGQKRYAGVHQNFRDAMAAPAKLPEFKGNVTAVLTEKYWDPELDEVAEKKNLVNAKAKELKAAGLSKEESEKQLEEFTKKTLTPRDLELLKGITNADYHYKGSAKVMAQIGKAFAEAAYELRKR